MLWSAASSARTIASVPKIRAEDKLFAKRLGNVLRELRERAGWTQEEAAEELGVVLGTLGRWERGDYAPKGYDMGRLFRGYQRFGAQWEWFFDPPEVVVVNPVRARLDELERAGTIAAEKREGRVAARRRKAGGLRVVGPGKPRA